MDEPALARSIRTSVKQDHPKIKCFGLDDRNVRRL